MRTIKKAALDKKVAITLGRKVQDVTDITTEFIAAIREALVEMNTVRIDGLGQLRVVPWEGKVDHLQPRGLPIVATSRKKYRVSFKKAAPLTRAVQERFGGAHVEKVVCPGDQSSLVPQTSGSMKPAAKKGSAVDAESPDDG